MSFILDSGIHKELLDQEHFKETKTLSYDRFLNIVGIIISTVMITGDDSNNILCKAIIF